MAWWHQQEGIQNSQHPRSGNLGETRQIHALLIPQSEGPETEKGGSQMAYILLSEL